MHSAPPNEVSHQLIAAKTLVVFFTYSVQNDNKISPYPYSNPISLLHKQNHFFKSET